MPAPRTTEGVGWVADTWEDTGQPVGGVFRVGVVFTVAPWPQEGAKPWTPWGSVCAFALNDQPSPDPVERFRQAVQQEHARAAERLGGTMKFELVWP